MYLDGVKGRNHVERLIVGLEVLVVWTWVVPEGPLAAQLMRLHRGDCFDAGFVFVGHGFSFSLR